MFDWLSWRVFFLVVILVFIALNRVFDFIGKVRAIWPSRANPQLLEVKNCFVSSGNEAAWFDLLVDNTGSKDCSLILVELEWPNGAIADFEGPKPIDEPRTPLPATILPGRTKRVIMLGFFHGANRLKLQPEQNSVEATVAVKFNTGQTIKKKITFIIKRT